VYTAVEVQFHAWPWSVGCKEETIDLVQGNVEVSFYGSPVISISSNTNLFLGRRYEQFSPFGPCFRSADGTYQLFQAPHGVIATKNSRETEAFAKRDQETIEQNKLLIKGISGTEEILLTMRGALSSQFEEDGVVAESPLYRSVLRWSNFFDECLDKARAMHNVGEMPWDDMRAFIGSIAENAEEPRKALIVHISELMRRRLATIVYSARRILVRERKLLPAGRVAETDTSCLRWFVRQPGETTAQKAAANRQQLLAISRRESLDTLENMVLKDFLRRCRRECNRYLRFDCNEKQLQTSSRARQVKAFDYLCNDLHNTPHLENVSPPPVAIRPNYVLQNDARYRQVWGLYRRLLRQEDEEDRLWDWQSRTWADLARLLLNSALLSLCNENISQKKFVFKEMTRSYCAIFQEQRLGARTVAGSEPGPFLITFLNKRNRQSCVLEIVHSSLSDQHPVTESLGRMGGHLYLVVTPLNGDRQSVIVVWIVHTASCSTLYRPDWDMLRCSASEALQRHTIILEDRKARFPNIFGLVVASDLESSETTIHPSEPGRVHLIQIPTDPSLWGNSLGWIALTIEDFLELAI
jgi:hypothetical protein